MYSRRVWRYVTCAQGRMVHDTPEKGREKKVRRKRNRQKRQCILFSTSFFLSSHRAIFPSFGVQLLERSARVCLFVFFSWSSSCIRYINIEPYTAFGLWLAWRLISCIFSNRMLQIFAISDRSRAPHMRHFCISTNTFSQKKTHSFFSHYLSRESCQCNKSIAVYTKKKQTNKKIGLESPCPKC